ncbi:polysaccharide pyruvyl transferase family protein [Methanospirillum lacunae]|uniref:Polysaccharide pyruvyl transferase family protein n=1 Tax=Methanospirillum lacunae TaxID=668570 RepID=A0A2V2MZ73_9EURY|nr:polysaccharide pyruvyl transferase family protein [Methanospirillum lacunae]PWR72769.1 polysaccharide pyruvyl transferase family protein [Methanospirillum lacunae]
MNHEQPLFILAGNGSYENRGCEAIIRGTTKILRKFYCDPKFICLSHFQSEKIFQYQSRNEIDRNIIHISSSNFNRNIVLKNFWKLNTWRDIYHFFLKPESINRRVYKNMFPYLHSSTAVLSIGGDNYSLDYGIPKLFTTLDDLVLEHQKPLFIWGASIGPFNQIGKYEKYMSQHLNKVTGIFARESATTDYLHSIEVRKNVSTVADPAFLMEHEKPKGIDDYISLEKDSIGINLSPMMAKYVTGGDIEAWVLMASEIIQEICSKSDSTIYLIPHVTSLHSDDYRFMKEIFSRISCKKNKCVLIPPSYTASEMKWIISQMTFFIGSRTHATIAALSTSVPTLSLGYSLKAKGINQDIFGHNNYSLGPDKINSKTVVDMFSSMQERESEIRRELDLKIPTIKELALSAGDILKNVLDKY